MQSLLSFIDEAVRARPGPAGFEGHLCVVERCTTGDRYWHLSATRRELAFGFRDDVPDGCTALLVFDEADGEAVLREGERGESFHLSGDKQQLTAMLERYLGGSTWLAVRVGKKNK